MKPGFIRFPGGCIVEGFDLDSRYQWKKTIGDPKKRELMKNRWNDEFKHRPAPDYYQSFGLGFYEYFQLAEDIGASPLPILSCGMACQFNSAELVPLDELDPYVQDALDLIEFANGSNQTKWGKVREQLGHPSPFNLKMIGVGNEQWGPQYLERYKVFSEAIRSRYPDIKLVSGTGPFPEGELFDYAAKELKTLKADLVDEHYYQKPDWFFKNATRYDNYDRNSYKIFAGEFAAQSVATVSPDNKNSWLCALSEAAFMTGLERNADVVYMASYAPLFAHTQRWQWTPDLIWFDNLSAYGTPNYYVQKLFSTNKGTHLASITMEGKPATGQQNIYASATVDNNTSEVIIKVVNSAGTPAQTEILLDPKKKYNSTVKGTMLANSDLSSVNSIEKPKNISPVDYTLSMKSNKIALILPPQSLVVLRVKGR
jgi:alpha-N-arabinofuranosidase